MQDEPLDSVPRSDSPPLRPNVETITMPEATGLPPTPVVVPSLVAPVAQTPPSSETAIEPRRPWGRWWRIAGLTVGIVLLLGGGFWAWFQSGRRQAPVRAGSFAPVHLPLDRLSVTQSPADAAGSLKIKGDLQVKGSLLLLPTAQPQSPVTGQLYYDQATNRLTYYDGTQFIQAGGSAGTTNTTNTTNITNILGSGGGGGVQLQATAPGLQQTGNFNVSGIGQVGTLRTNQINSGGGALLVNGQALFRAPANSATAFRVQNAASQDLLAIDTLAGHVRVQSAGSGDVTLATAAGSGVSGNITIQTGSSSTTASGDITIDAGVGVVDGEVVGTKTFESGTDNMVNWFGSTVTQSSAQAHNGANSLSMTASAGFWGVQENINNPITSVVAGHQYHFSLWLRAGTTPRSITSRAVWIGGGGGFLNLQTVTDSTTGWTEVTGTGPAPAGATGVYTTMQSTATVGEVHYFDDIVITDLSSATAASTINLGSTNAKIVTIGNINQIGPTSIRGGSGIDLTSGAAGITLNGGVLTLAANAASSFGTTAGALTLTSAASATWGIATATTGVGGNLTLRAGGGGTDANNDGGDLLLQGGTPNGTGLAGGVIVKPQTDATNAFQVQTSAGTPLLTVDSTGLQITVAGTDTTYASFVLTDAHLSSTQTTPPTIGTPTNCGTTPTAVVTAGSTDTAGSFTITTGTGGTASTCDSVLTFHHAYGAAPKSIIVVGKSDADSAARQIYVAGATATTFTVAFGDSAAGANSTPYSFSYWVIE